MLSMITLDVVMRMRPTVVGVTRTELIDVAAMLWLTDDQLARLHPEWCANLDAPKRSSRARAPLDRGSSARKLRQRLRAAGWRIDLDVRELALASPERSGRTTTTRG
ncbi:MAG: hypothetical protein K8M05_28905 [Deltaproteobacteria bacterium]|nr:hypothetical protein [Kofleriaceae bacterium]